MIFAWWSYLLLNCTNSIFFTIYTKCRCWQVRWSLELNLGTYKLSQDLGMPSYVEEKSSYFLVSPLLRHFYKLVSFIQCKGRVPNFKIYGVWVNVCHHHTRIFLHMKNSFINVLTLKSFHFVKKVLTLHY